MRVGQTILVKQNANNSELQRAIEAVIPAATKQAASIADRYKGKNEAETCKKIFDYLKNNINYKADGANQAVRLPSGLMRTLQGDCKSYSVFTSAILSNLGIPHKLVYASYDASDPTPTHIYVMTNSGCIIDAVYGKFNAEKKPTYKKYKNMNISYIAGMNTRRRGMGNMANNSIGRSCGIGATMSGLEWARQFGVVPNKSEAWLAINNGSYRKYAANKILIIAAGGRGVVRKLLEKNAGGMATSLNTLYQAAKANNASEQFKKYRSLEIDWFENGGNPNEFLESIQEGAKKTPTGKYFNKLMKMRAGGYTPNIAQWIAAGISVMFGKKYNESTGQIKGNNSGIGDPATAGGTAATAPWWAPYVTKIVIVLGSTAILGTVGSALGEDGTEGGTGQGEGQNNNTGGGGNDNNNEGSGRSALLPILLIGGAAAAYFILKPSKK
jgi:hypothetical protein